MKSKLVPIIDVDSVVYRCGFASDSSKDEHGNPIDEPLENCLHSVKLNLQSILDVFEPTDKAKVFLQGSGNYRDRIATIQPYKGNRDPSKRPRYFDEIRTYLLDYWGAELVNKMETDDACGITQWKHRDKSTCIVTIDKDLDMIPGWHYNYVKKEMYWVDLATANKKFWTQVLTGDTTDNIRGIPKVGIKTAEKLLSNVESWVDMHGVVREAYARAGITDEFHENATLLWIQREPWVNYNGEKIDVSGDSRRRSETEDGKEVEELSECGTDSSES